MNYFKRTIGFWVCTILSFPLFSQSWTPQNAQSSRDLHSVFFVNDSVGWTLGKGNGGNSAGNIRATPNQGNLWGIVNLGEANVEIQASFFFNEMRGVAVGKHSSGDFEGFRAITFDGGLSWANDIFSFEEELMDVHFADSLRGWLVGEEGTIAKSIDGGISWALQSSPTNEDLMGVFAITDQVILAVGEKGKILRSQDGGMNWVAVGSPTDKGLHSVFFSSFDHGWITGDDGVILQTTNAGLSWTMLNSTTDRVLTDVHFVNDTLGWVVGKSGTVLNTVDGGISWVHEQSNTSQHIWDVYMVNDSLGWFCGQNGMIHIRQPSSLSTLISPPHFGPGVNIRFYPNPTYGGQASLSIEGYSIDSIHLTMMDLNGKIWKRWDFQQGDPNVLNVSDCPDGVYLLKVVLDDQSPLYLKWRVGN